MRNLDFKVTAQVLEPVGDFSNLVPGTEGYLFANFTFSKEWDGCVKVASFFDRKGKEHAQYIVNNKCEIPKEVLLDRCFRLKVSGAKSGFHIPTNIITVKQKG